MSDRDEKRDEMSNRMAKRFESGSDTESGSDSDTEQSNESSESSQSSERSELSQTSENPERSNRDSSSDEADDDRPSDELHSTSNVKKEWPGTYIYLPPKLDAPLDSEYDRLTYECGRDLDWKPKKNKHYYPVVIADGVEAVQAMDAADFERRVVDLGLKRADE